MKVVQIFALLLVAVVVVDAAPSAPPFKAIGDLFGWGYKSWARRLSVATPLKDVEVPRTGCSIFDVTPPIAAISTSDCLGFTNPETGDLEDKVLECGCSPDPTKLIAFNAYIRTLDKIAYKISGAESVMSEVECTFEKANGTFLVGLNITVNGFFNNFMWVSQYSAVKSCSIKAIESNEQLKPGENFTQMWYVNGDGVVRPGLVYLLVALVTALALVM